MAIISRLTTWAVGQILKAADLNAEFNNITNLLNNLDAATSAWTNVKAATINGTTAYQFNGTSMTKLMQVVLGTSTTASTTTTSAFAASNATASITPSSTSSKILIWSSLPWTMGASVNAQLDITIFRGATNLALGASTSFAEIKNQVASTARGCVHLSYLDSPATVSATTYTIKYASDDNAQTVGIGNSTDTQVLILAEIL